MRRAAILLGVLILTGLAASWTVGTALTRPHPAPATPPSPYDLTIVSADSMSLAATYLPGPRDRAPAILLLHPKGGSRRGFDTIAAWLNRQGYATLAIDFRGHGQASPARYSFGWSESRDAAAAFRWLKRQQQGAPVAVVGLSLGGAASLLGEGPLPADALVLQGVYGDLRSTIRNRIATVAGAGLGWLLEPLLSFQSKPRIGMWPGEFSPRSRIAAYPGPLLVIGGEADRYTPPSETRSLYDAAPGPKRLWLAPGASHEAVTALDTPAYRRTLLAFLRERLPTTPRAR